MPEASSSSSSAVFSHQQHLPPPPHLQQQGPYQPYYAGGEPLYTPAIDPALMGPPVKSEEDGSAGSQGNSGSGGGGSFTSVKQEEEDPSAAAAVAPGPPKKTKEKRVLVACRACRASKVKCMNTGSPPCTLCVAAKRECIFPERGTSLIDRAPRGFRQHKSRAQKDAEGANGASKGKGAGTTSSASAPPPSKTSKVPSLPPLDTAIAQTVASTSSANAQLPPTTASSSESTTTTLDVARLQSYNSHSNTSNRIEEPLLPPHELVVEGCEIFFTSYFQIGFIHQPSFMQSLRSQDESLDAFLVLAILSISARFTPSLIERYGGKQRAVQVLSEKALSLATDRMLNPTIQVVQAFHLLGLTDWTLENGFRSRMLQANALQAAEMLELHVPRPEMSVIENMVRQRTWWFLVAQLTLANVGTAFPNTFDVHLTRVPLPVSEEDFMFGIPSEPQYLVNDNEGQSSHPLHQSEYSMLSALLISMQIWGKSARMLTSGEYTNSLPWDQNSTYSRILKDMDNWYNRLPERLKWSTMKLTAYRQLNLDIAFYSMYALFHMSNLVLRRGYLPVCIQALHPRSAEASANSEDPGAMERQAYWSKMADEIMKHAEMVIELADNIRCLRDYSCGSTPNTGFAVYTAGSIMNYLRLCPWLAPSRAPTALKNLSIALTHLAEIGEYWFCAQSWYSTLLQQAMYAQQQNEGTETVASQLANHELHLDRVAGIYRQFASKQSSNGHQVLPGHFIPPGGQAGAAATLCSLAGTGNPSYSLAQSFDQPSSNLSDPFFTPQGISDYPTEPLYPLFQPNGEVDLRNFETSFDANCFETDLNSYMRQTVVA